jgi:GNAT superfamily N-acetyltransferase
MNQDRIRNFWGIYDLTYMRDKTRTWIALYHETIVGYLLEHDKRVLHTRGNAQCIVPLLKNTNLTTPTFNIEPLHLAGVKRLYKPTEPTDATSKGKVTTYLLMRVNADDFKPAMLHNVQEMGTKDNTLVTSLLSREPSRIADLLKGFSFGLYVNGRLVSFAAAPDVLEDLAIIRGVYTTPDLRRKGYSTSVCSALVAKVLETGRDAILYVSKDNKPAIRVYRKLGFKETEHVFLSFKAEKRVGKVR